MAEAQFRRRSKLIDGRVQVGVSLKVLLMLGFYLLAFCLMALAAPLYTVITGSGSPAAVEAARLRLSTASEIFLVPLLFASACFCLHCILMLHRLAGPLHRLGRTFDEMSGRDLSTRIVLRKGDYLGDLSARYNLAAQVLREDLGNAVDTARDVVSGLDAAGDGEAVADARARAEELLEGLEAWRLERGPAAPEAGPAGEAEKAEAEEVGAA